MEGKSVFLWRRAAEKTPKKIIINDEKVCVIQKFNFKIE